MKRYAFCLMLGLGLTASTHAEITGSIIPNSISPVHSPGQRKTYTFDFCASIEEGSGKADVLLLTDSTGSMPDYVTGLREASGDILSSIAGSLPGVDVRYSMADYKDYRDGRNYTPYGVNLLEPFTSDTSAVTDAIDSMYAHGGYDLQEAQLKALVSLAENWMTPSGDLGFNGRADAQKIVVWAGDAEGHYFGVGGDGPPDYYPSLEDTLAALNARGIVTFGLNIKPAGEGIDTDAGGARQATYLTSGTGGYLVNELALSPQEIEAAIVDAVMAGVETLTNITLALESEADFAGEAPTQTIIGSWTPADGEVCGSFSFDITSPDQAGIAEFDLVLLGNGAELDRVSVHLTTTPEPSTFFLLGLGGLGLLRRRRGEP